MSLEAKLAELREAGAKRIPEDKRAVLGAHAQSLRDSGAVDKALKVGDALPAFNLTDTNGEEITSAALLAKGPLVVTIYRGQW